MSTRFGIQQVQINGTEYPGVVGYELERGLQIESDHQDGTVHQTMHHLVERQPGANLTTRNLKTVLAALSSSLDLPMLTLDGSNGMVMRGAQYNTGLPGYASGSGHPKRTALRGLVFLQRCSWSRGAKRADFNLRALFHSGSGGGDTDSVTEGTAALPTLPTPDFGFGLTALSVGGDALTRIESIELAIEAPFAWEYDKGLPNPVDISGPGMNGPLGITLSATGNALDLGDGTGSTTFTLTKYAQGGGWGSDTVTFTLNSVWSVEDGWSAAPGGPMTRRLMARAYYNGTTRPLTWAVA